MTYFLFTRVLTGFILISVAKRNGSRVTDRRGEMTKSQIERSGKQIATLVKRSGFTGETARDYMMDWATEGTPGNEDGSSDLTSERVFDAAVRQARALGINC